MPDLTIRAAEPGDADALTRLVNMPGVRHGTLRLPFTPRALIERRLDARSGVHALVAALDGDIVGQGVLIQQEGRRAHVGLLILYVADDHVGQGIGRALTRALLDLADNWIGLRRVELDVNADNHRAIALYERMGFVREGTRAADTLRDGVLVDSHIMARLRDAPPRQSEAEG